MEEKKCQELPMPLPCPLSQSCGCVAAGGRPWVTPAPGQAGPSWHPALSGGVGGQVSRPAVHMPRPLFLPKPRGPGSHQPPLAPGAAPRISLSKTNHSERRLLHPDSRAPESGLLPLNVRHPSTRPFRLLQNQPQLGLLLLRLPGGQPPPSGLQVHAHWAPSVASPLNGAYCLQLVPQVCFLPSGND